MADVTISYTIGEVYLVRSNKKRRIEAIPFKKSVTLKDSDRIITGPASYVTDLWDTPSPITDEKGTGIVMFPNSELVLGIKGNHLIMRIELVAGLFKLTTDKKIITQTAELQFPYGGNVFWIDVAKDDGSVVVASEAVPMEVIHKKTKKAAVISFKQQVSVTHEDILEPCGVDQRFKEACKTLEILEQSKAKFLYGDMLERKVPQKLAKFQKVIEEKTGRKEDYDFAKYQKWLKEQKEFGEWKYDEVVESKLPEFKPVKAEEKKILVAKPKLTEINKSVNYQGISFKVVSVQKTIEFKGRNAPEGEEFLVLNVEAKNNSPNQVIIFYEEEVRLLNEFNEVIPLENYKLENNFDAQFETEGLLLFLVPKEDVKFKLQFGKNSLPKVEIEFEVGD